MCQRGFCNRLQSGRRPQADQTRQTSSHLSLCFSFGYPLAFEGKLKAGLSSHPLLKVEHFSESWKPNH